MFVTLVVVVVASVVTGAVVVVSAEFNVGVVEVGELVIAFTRLEVVEATVEVVELTGPERVVTVGLIVVGATARVLVTVGTAESTNDAS